MEKLSICRICLVENVPMYKLVNKNLHELYEKLTYIPFVTEDSRPVLVCFVCCAQLKKCYRFRTKCLEGEERFAHIMNADFELKPLINRDHLELFHGFIKTPIQSINIVDVGHTASLVVKEELPTVLKTPEDVIEPKVEQQSDDELEAKNLYDTYLDIEYIPPRSQPDSEDDVPLTEFKTEVEEEQAAINKREAKKRKSSALCDIQMSRRSLYTLFRDSAQRKFDKKFLVMEQKVKEITKCPENEFRIIRHDLRHFKSDLKQRWSLANYTEARFLSKNNNWLDNSITMHSWSTKR